MSSFVPIPSRPVIALLTDFGLNDGYIGVMKGVILTICSDAHCIDITHDIAPQNVAAAAWILATAYRYFPTDTVFTCVVDPGVGSKRGAIAVHAGSWRFVGPDNGLFSYIYKEQTVQQAVALTNAAYHLPNVSSTFHGRDIFAPASAHIARGVPLDKLGAPLDPAILQRLDIASPVRNNDSIEGHIAHIDRFGNLITNIPLTLVPDLFSNPQIHAVLPAKGTVITHVRRFFGEQTQNDTPFLYSDSSGYIGIAIRNGDAARVLRAFYGEPVIITFVTSNDR